MMLANLLHWFLWSGCLALIDPFWGQSEDELRAYDFASTPELEASVNEVTKELLPIEVKNFKKLVIMTGSLHIVSKVLKCMTFEDILPFSLHLSCSKHIHVHLLSVLPSILMEPSAAICSQIHILFRALNREKYGLFS